MWPRAFAVWLLIVVAESVHGTLRQLVLAPLIGDLPARQWGVLLAPLPLAIEMGSDAVDIGKTIHPHPALGESIGMAVVSLRAVSRMCLHRRSDATTPRKAQISTKSSSTSESTPKPRASPRHVGHRCGMTVVRRSLERVCMLWRTGI